MPEKRRNAERLLENALEALTKALNECGAPWMIIGGIAIIARGVRRFTTDIDAAVRGDVAQPAEVLQVLKRHGIVPRIENALSFAEANLVLLVRHEKSGVELDVSFAWSAFERDALASRTVAAFGAVSAPMCTVEALLVFKALAGRGKDIEDIEALLDLYPDVDLRRVRSQIAQLTALAEAPELLERFDVTIAGRPGTAKKARSPRAVPAAPPRKKARRKAR